MLKIKNGRVITGGSVNETNVYVENGKIYAVTDKELPFDKVIDAHGNYVSAGFIDTHVHGGGNADFMDGGTEPIRVAAKAHLKYGTTSICPTSLACSYDVLKQFIYDYKSLLPESGKNGMPNLVGMHLEGPYFSPGQAGAQPPQYIYPPKKEEYEEVIDIAEGNIIKWSFAPELDGTEEFCDALVSAGIMPSVAHTDGNYYDVMRVYEHGARSMTHFYSCMPSITRKNGYRIPGVVEAGYLLDDMWIEIIADGSHIPPVLLKMIFKLKGTDKILLVTDSMRGATMPEGPSKLGRLSEGHDCIIEDGIAKMPDRQCFAGSVATSDRLVRTLVENGICDLPTAVMLVTENPAKCLGIKNKGELKEGYDADIVIFDGDIRMKNIIVMGEPV